MGLHCKALALLFCSLLSSPSAMKRVCIHLCNLIIIYFSCMIGEVAGWLPQRKLPMACLNIDAGRDIRRVECCHEPDFCNKNLTPTLVLTTTGVQRTDRNFVNCHHFPSAIAVVILPEAVYYLHSW